MWKALFFLATFRFAKGSSSVVKPIFLEEQAGVSAHETNFNVNGFPAPGNLNVIYRRNGTDVLHFNFYFPSDRDAFMETVYCTGSSGSLTPQMGLSCPTGESIQRIFLQSWTDSSGTHPLGSFKWSSWTAEKRLEGSVEYWKIERTGVSGALSMRFFGFVLPSLSPLSIPSEKGSGRLQLEPFQFKFGLQLSGANVETQQLQLDFASILKGTVLPEEKAGQLVAVYGPKVRFAFKWEKSVDCGGSSFPVGMKSSDNSGYRTWQWSFPKPCGEKTLWWDPTLALEADDDNDPGKQKNENLYQTDDACGTRCGLALSMAVVAAFLGQMASL
eukprot:TRINITY_DN18570_c0_g1_i2.p1 TRINITY_DN18570_c0_g1~~TRINITY_DN18570_c0_g1_i2.p1  ORF type:complete len:329 (-),score=38.21 TRINITY_DN18570_c0_g1_i2:136-1122(-)